MKKLIFLLITGFTVWLIIQYPKQMINPGELTTGHQKLNEKCFSCHKPFWGISNDKCISCHKISEIGKDTISGKEKILFHENLVNQNCSSCHTDHMGKNPETSLSSFKHELLSENILKNCISCHKKPENMLHTSISDACYNCHTTKGWKESVKFNHDMIQGIDKNNCLSCHQKPNDSFHQTQNENCGKCHSSEKWIPSTFNHSSFFILDKNHNSKCVTCHATNNYKEYTCYGCHEHTKSNIMHKHDEVSSSNINDCVSCHKSGNEHDMKDGKSEREENESKHKNKKEENEDEDDD